MAKRAIDIALSLAGLVFLAPLFLLAAIAVKLESRGPVFFRQERMGRDFKPFRIYKFRTMAQGSGGPSITVAGDSRVTRAGAVLRKTKIDELPQLLNVLKGEMSMVGPRPEVRQYVEMFRDDYAFLLSQRPGITDPASLAYSNEEAVLSTSSDWEKDYTEKVLPEKIRLSRQYVETQGLASDLSILIRTGVAALRGLF